MILFRRQGFMKYKVTGKQENSKSCLVCGMKNDFGLKTSFYEMENGEVVSIFNTKNEHQSYPGRLHGGITGAILDETIGRAIMIKDKKVWGVTIELNLSYKKPIPLNTELKAVGRITKDSSRIFEGTGELLLPSGEIAATAHGRYMKMSIDKISNIEDEDMEWQIVQSQEDPEEIEL
jgi:uncharacterized protein (TIGR00369 family)